MYSSVARRWKLHKRLGAALLAALEFLCASFVMRKGINMISVVMLPIAMVVVFALWVVIAKVWVHRQFGPLYTMAVNVVENSIDEESGCNRLKEWMEKHKDIYDPTYIEEYSCGNIDSLNSIRKKISLIHIPLILMDGVPDDDFMKMAKEMGVMIHFIGQGGRNLPKDFKRVDRLKGLYVWSVS